MTNFVILRADGRKKGKKLSPALSAESGTSIADGYSIAVLNAAFLPFLKNAEYEREKEYDVKHLEERRRDGKRSGSETISEQRDKYQVQDIITEHSRRNAGRFDDAGDVSRKTDQPAPWKVGRFS